ncbi:Arginine--tRNA ligase [uncultured Ruminococcus sp.]|uniref:arginine--tRNA ligase n=1 Tax=Huintestinicola butyrica TaxID=2981728 RepID=UPI000822FD75|nr:arginine--tRNA ligase [Huintestinicola butyrica]MCU6728327.1 arginine--tRNA ligase [Huintestinicola butyrica]SCJ10380.1 Arginine--tRNA ligase [uncultured Ruminococcus sp.]
MQTITKALTDIVTAAFVKCGYPEASGVVTPSDRLDLCQFQCNGAFAAAKAYRKSPIAIASEVAEVLSSEEIFAKAEAVKPGFLNLTLSDEYMLSLAAGIDSDKFCGVPQADKQEKIVIDYGGPNVAKPLHIGHLRSAIIGESLKRLARACGCTVYSDVHLGDWGLQIGLVIAELSERYPDWKCFSEDFKESDGVPPLSAELLCEVYPFASKKSKEDDDFKAKAHTATFELQSGRAGYIALWKEILRVSIADLKSNYEKLGVDFDYWYGESDADKYIPELMKILEDKHLSRESDGALVVDVAKQDDKAPMPPVIVRKSDNSSIYATTDLATIIQRNKDFAPDKIWYVVDNRQELHFTQVFRCARLAQLVPDSTELEFLGFGTMNGSDGKPYKTRDGGVMRLSDLIETVTNASLERLKDSALVAGEDREAYARKIGMAAIKFGDLINHRSKDYVFDLDKFMSTDGKTGVYLLYTVSRINSIMKKAEGITPRLTGVYSEAERSLILKMIMTGDVIEHAMNEKAPNYICENAYQLAVAFSSFYHENHIISEPDENKRSSWLALAALTRKMIVKHLDILGIEPVENM